MVQSNLHIPLDLSEEKVFTLYKLKVYMYLLAVWGRHCLVGSQTMASTIVSFKRFTYNT